MTRVNPWSVVYITTGGSHFLRTFFCEFAYSHRDNWSKNAYFQSKKGFLSANSVIAVQNEGTYIHISRETCIICPVSVFIIEAYTKKDFSNVQRGDKEQKKFMARIRTPQNLLRKVCSKEKDLFPPFVERLNSKWMLLLPLQQQMQRYLSRSYINDVINMSDDVIN